MDINKFTRWAPDCVVSATFKCLQLIPGMKKIMDKEDWKVLLIDDEEPVAEAPAAAAPPPAKEKD